MQRYLMKDDLIYLDIYHYAHNNKTSVKSATASNGGVLNKPNGVSQIPYATLRNKFPASF
jgi:hypothetical protein